MRETVDVAGVRLADEKELEKGSQLLWTTFGGTRTFVERLLKASDMTDDKVKCCIAKLKNAGLKIFYSWPKRGAQREYTEQR
jgi:hypothetical protein